MTGTAQADVMPRLDAFDEEFGPGPDTILRPRRRRLGLWFWALVGLLLGAGIIGAMTLVWPGAEAWLLRSEVQSAPMSTRTAAREGAEEQTTLLLREVAELKREIRELVSAQQEATETIAALKAAIPDSSSVHWYSDLAPLHFGIATQQEPAVGETGARRPAAVRARGNEFRRREEGGTPLSLEPPQN